MNKFSASLVAPLETQLAAQLRELLSNVVDFGDWTVSENPAEFGRTYDLRAVAQRPDGPHIELLVDCKANPRPVHFPYASVERQFPVTGESTTRIRVLAAPVIGPKMAKTCWEHGWSWFDLTGNCRLSIPGCLYIEREGLKSEHRIPKPPVNLGTPEASRVLRAMLSPQQEAIFWTQRDLQDRCEPGVSLGLVNKIVTHLREENYLKTDRGHYRIRDWLGLLAAWSQAYQFHRLRQIPLFTLKRPPESLNALQGINAPEKVRVAHAAFSAAEIQAPAVRQPKSWLMVSAECVDEVIAALEAKEVSSGDNLVLLVPPDPGPFSGPDTREGVLPCTNPLQTYLDLSHLSGRGEEAAEAILNQVLKPEWEAQN